MLLGCVAFVYRKSTGPACGTAVAVFLCQPCVLWVQKMLAAAPLVQVVWRVELRGGWFQPRHNLACTGFFGPWRTGASLQVIFVVVVAVGVVRSW